ncbi:DUF2341 domain-containing protein [Zavarzinia aquatilis]|nr:MotA/TolQ/ExbB proton channel family protein [Zavarzinia aquatilis]
MGRKGAGSVLAVMLGLLAGLTMLPGSAKAWWNDEWTLRKQLTIDTGANGAGITDPIGTSPVLIRLHSGNFQFEAAKPDGTDLRFVADDDTTPLKYHVEKFDSLMGEAFVWVSVPDLKPGAQAKLWLYYANPNAGGAEEAKASYDPDTLLVYHFTENGLPVRDYTTWNNTAQTAGVTADGSMIGRGLRLDGQTPVTLPASASLAFGNGAALTWSAWVKSAADQPNALIYSRRDGVSGLDIGMDNGVPFVELRSGFGLLRGAAPAAVAAGSWHHIAVTADGTHVRLYVDGLPQAEIAGAIAAMNTPALIGADAAPPPAPVAEAVAEPAVVPAEGTAPATEPAPEAAAPAPAAPHYSAFVGELDELQIAKVARPAGFIRLAALGQGGDSAKLLSLSVDEETASWLTGYFAVIVKSVTLDAWVVIGILAVMAVISWIVVAAKLSYVGGQQKANRRFLEAYDEFASDLSALETKSAEAGVLAAHLSKAELRLVHRSALYRVFHAGLHEIQRRFAGTPEGQRWLRVESITAIRASLDAVVVRETQKLNRQIVILTIAISGGPFLGLLGTVVGVMITFAAIAASGDVNVNAIAPGIAAALLATVAGLGVAIPALFAYNYLNSRIKDATADIHVFVDEFISRVAEFYAWSPEVPAQRAGDPLAAE